VRGLGPGWCGCASGMAVIWCGELPFAGASFPARYDLDAARRFRTNPVRGVVAAMVVVTVMDREVQAPRR